MTSPGLIVICGATATGKSDLAIALAESWHTVILSADSRQVYRQFDIGTAKPTPSDRQRVPHFFIDHCNPTETLTLGDYQSQVQALIQQCHQRGQTPLLVGGTGLYIKSITQGLRMPRVPPHADLRASLAQLGQTWCYPLLQQVDPAAAQRIHFNDAVRTIRALEVFYATGIPLSQQQGEDPPPYPIAQISLYYSDRAQFQDRIRSRTQMMWDNGFIAEVQTLRQQYGSQLPLLKTLGYAEVSDFLDGHLTEPEAFAQVVQHTLQFAKRQRTWFRHIPEIQWFPVDDESQDLLTAVQKHCSDFDLVKM